MTHVDFLVLPAADVFLVFIMKIHLLLTLLVTVNVNAFRNTLVLLDNQVIKETHSIFFKQLQGKYSH